MDGAGQSWQLEVLAGGDALRQERLTQGLLEALKDADGITAGYVDVEAPGGDGRKGGGTTDMALWVAGIAGVAGPASKVLVAVVKEWCARDRHHKVKLTSGDDSVTITGRPDEAQERIIREFLGRVGPARDSDAEGATE